MLKDLYKLLADRDAAIIQANIDSIPARRAVIASVPPAGLSSKRNTLRICNRVGGAEWYNRLRRDNDASVIRWLEETYRYRSLERHGRMTDWVERLGITEVFARSIETVEGVTTATWGVDTPDGRKRVTVTFTNSTHGPTYWYAVTTNVTPWSNDK